jgi:ATP-dependent DNA helicase RecQ
MKTPKPERKMRTKRDANGDDTYTISLKMFQSGASVGEIAQKRGMTRSTIETHLVRFIQTSEISVADLVPEKKIEPIRNAIIELHAETGIGQVKEYLGEDYSYGEIRAVIAEFMRRGYGD